jgi:hypothetical protein
VFSAPNSLPHQFCSGGSDKNTIVAHVNVVSVPARSKQKDQTFFFLQVDTAANITLVRFSMEQAKAVMTNVRLAKNKLVMMNAHPAEIVAFGSMTFQVLDDNTNTWKWLTIDDVAVVPSSKFNLLGWTPYAKQLEKQRPVPTLVLGSRTVTLPIGRHDEATGRARGGLFSLKCRLRDGEPAGAGQATANVAAQVKEEKKSFHGADPQGPAHVDDVRLNRSLDAGLSQDVRLSRSLDAGLPQAQLGERGRAAASGGKQVRAAERGRAVASGGERDCAGLGVASEVGRPARRRDPATEDA